MMRLKKKVKCKENTDQHIILKSYLLQWYMSNEIKEDELVKIYVKFLNFLANLFP